MSLARDGDPPVILVLLTDHSRTVSGIDEAPDAEPIMDDRFSTIPGYPSALALHWLGSTCESNVEIEVRDTASLTFTISRTVAPMDCAAVGVPRAILVTFSRLVDPGRILVQSGD